MTKLTNTASILKKIGVPAIIFVIAGASIFLIYLRFFKPPESAPVPKPPVQELPITTGSFDIAGLELEGQQYQQLPLYQKQSSASLLENASEIASIFEFNQNPQELNDVNEGKTLLYLKDESTLLIREEFLSYSKVISEDNQAEGANPENSRALAQNLFGRLGTQTDLLKENRLILLKTLTGETVPLTSPESATFVNIQYVYQVSGLPVITPTSPLSITLDNQGTIISLIYKQFKQPEALKQYPLIGLESATNLLLSQQGSAINIHEGQEASDISNLEKVALKKAYLAYYLPGETPQILQPFWIFEGEIPNGDSLVKIQYAVPAIEEKFIQKN